MKKTVVFHNPKSGDAEHDKDEIIAALERHNYKVQYYSTKRDWKSAKLFSDEQLIVIAGGDGTVRKITGWLLETGILKKEIPITILPLGTANNLSKTLNISGTYEQLIEQWPNWKIQPYDIGRIVNSDEPKKNKSFFLEALGCGLFAHHLHNAKEEYVKKNEDNPEKKIKVDQERLLLSLSKLPPCKVDITIDNKDYHGEYLLVSIMNSRHFGTNLEFNPQSESGDGKFDVILIAGTEREILEQFITGQREASQNDLNFKGISGYDITLRSGDHLYHLDDTIYDAEEDTLIHIRANDQQLLFLAP